MRIGKGAICLGYVIAYATNLDGVINRHDNDDGIKFTPAAPVYHTESFGLNRNRQQRRQVGGSGKAGALLGSAIPMTAEHQTQIAFKRTVTNHKGFDTLVDILNSRTEDP